MNLSESLREKTRFYFNIDPSLPFDQDSLRSAHKKACKKFHPDIPGGNAERFQEMQETYEKLMKLLNRNDSDKRIRQFISGEQYFIFYKEYIFTDSYVKKKISRRAYEYLVDKNYLIPDDLYQSALRIKRDDKYPICSSCGIPYVFVSFYSLEGVLKAEIGVCPKCLGLVVKK